jgi:hypothetical protein
MKAVGLKLHGLHLLSTHFASGRVLASIQPASHGQALRGGGPGNQMHDCFVITQRLATPVGGDEGEQPVLDLVPLAGARREVADRDGEPGLIGELLQLKLPQAQPVAITPAGIGGDENALGPAVDAAAFRPPPAADRGNGEGTGIVVGADVDEAGIAADVVDPVRIGARDLRTGEVVTLDMQRFLRRQPLPTLVFVVADEFLLLGVDRDDRQPFAQVLLDFGADVSELRVPVGMICSLSVLRLLCKL